MVTTRLTIVGLHNMSYTITTEENDVWNKLNTLRYRHSRYCLVTIVTAMQLD